MTVCQLAAFFFLLSFLVLLAIVLVALVLCVELTAEVTTAHNRRWQAADASSGNQF